MNQQLDLSEDTARRLEAVYETIARESMSDMPLYNEALEVEAFGFQDYSGHQLGIVITPWFMNLTLVPEPADDIVPKPVGTKESFLFPAGRFEFVNGDLDDFGRVLTCSLYSPMFEFDDPDVARQTAVAALDALMDPDNVEDVSRPADDEPQLGAPPPVAQEVSRRRFLRGELRGEKT